MKKILYTLSIVILLSSCGKDDESIITHEVGSWTLDSYVIINVPSGFEERNEGTIYSIDGISIDGIVIDSYDLTLNSDMTYDRSLGVTGPNINDSGVWELGEEEFVLRSDEDGRDSEFKVEENENDQLWLSVPTQVLLLHDTVTSKYFNSLDDEGKNDLFTVASIDLVYAFERE